MGGGEVHSTSIGCRTHHVELTRFILSCRTQENKQRDASDMNTMSRKDKLTRCHCHCV